MSATAPVPPAQVPRAPVTAQIPLAHHGADAVQFPPAQVPPAQATVTSSHSTAAAEAPRAQVAAHVQNTFTQVPVATQVTAPLQNPLAQVPVATQVPGISIPVDPANKRPKDRRKKPTDATTVSTVELEELEALTPQSSPAPTPRKRTKKSESEAKSPKAKAKAPKEKPVAGIRRSARAKY